jgi:hypothetical protein
VSRAPARAFALLGILSFFLICTQARAESPVEIALLPFELVNVPPDEQPRFQRLLTDTLKQRRTLILVEPARTSEALSGRTQDCAEQMECLSALGKQLRADKLLRLRVGRLGDTVVVRLKVFDVQRGAYQGSWQEVLRQETDQALAGALERMVTSFAPRPPAPRPWYSRWWVWTAAGTVVAGAVTAVLLATRDSEPEPDWTIILPGR